MGSIYSTILIICEYIIKMTPIINVFQLNIFQNDGRNTCNIFLIVLWELCNLKDFCSFNISSTFFLVRNWNLEDWTASLIDVNPQIENVRIKSTSGLIIISLKCLVIYKTKKLT